jgi:hypothetical protein
VAFEDDEGCLFLGELGLDGALRHTNGILPMVALARDRGIRTVFVPALDAQEAALVEGVTTIPVATLGALIGHLRGDLAISAAAGRGLRGGARPGACQTLPGSGRSFRGRGESRSHNTWPLRGLAGGISLDIQKRDS